jgi:serine/threonine protein kinase
MTGHIHSSGELIAERYRIVEFLNEGGMQEVYVADDEKLKRRVALKVPKTTSAERRFDRSARLSAKVIHPNVAATFDYFEDSGRGYLIEELVPGSDLKVRFDTEFYYLDPRLAAYVLVQLARGVAAAHHAGVCHRDLKPSNVIVSSDANLSVVKITDFGIAKLAESELAEGVEKFGKDESSITGSKTLVGAIPYMAPEHFLTPGKASLPGDVWAIGAILYQLLSGEPPFGRGVASIAKILSAETKVVPPPLFFTKASFKPLEEELWKVLTSCLQYEPANRPTADDLVRSASELCYSSAERMVGVVTNYGDREGNWGFISCWPNDAFIHGSCFYGRGIKGGLRVNFAPHQGIPNPRASPALPLRD